ncbi:nucleotidyltransferase domain-containing protein [Variovorax sp. KK3]|nr:nucleotidyltransferase domain-containing protein [Variovorax sp. KK3]
MLYEIQLTLYKAQQSNTRSVVINERMFSELFGGSERFRALRYLFEHANEEFGSRELAAAAHTDRGNTHRWLKRWQDAGLVVEGRDSPTHFRASRDPTLVPLVTLFRQSSDLVADLRASLDELRGIEAAAIFGSYARHEEKASSDVDVLVLGDVSELKTNAALKPLARKYGRPFNASVLTTAEFGKLVAERDGFAMDVMAHPLVHLKGDVHPYA